MGDPAGAYTGASFPDNLRDQYGAQDFRLQSALVCGDIRFLERHYSAQKGMDGQAALMELYRRSDMTNDLRRAAQSYRALLRQQPASAWQASRLWLALARSHEYLGEWNEAADNYRRSLQYQKNTASTWERIMEMEIARSRVEASEAACREWLKARAAGERLRQRELARLYERLGVKNVAAETYARASEHMPLDLSLLAGYLRNETSERRRVDTAARLLARDGHNLSTVQGAVEALIAQGRALEARQVLERLSPFFSVRRSVFWSLLIARASEAAGDWARAASAFMQARIWRQNAPAEEQAYYLLHEADAYARLGRTRDTEQLLAQLKSAVWNEGAVFVRLRLLSATGASGKLMESLLLAHAAQPGGSFGNQTTYFMARLSDFVDAAADAAAIAKAEAKRAEAAATNAQPDAGASQGTEEPDSLVTLTAITEGLWLAHLERKTDPLAAYEAGRFFLRIGKTEKAYELFTNARSGMRAFGGMLPYLVITAERLGRAQEAEEYRAQACYLLGRAVYLDRRARILANM